MRFVSVTTWEESTDEPLLGVAGGYTQNSSAKLQESKWSWLIGKRFVKSCSAGPYSELYEGEVVDGEHQSRILMLVASVCSACLYCRAL